MAAGFTQSTRSKAEYFIHIPGREKKKKKLFAKNVSTSLTPILNRYPWKP